MCTVILEKPGQNVDFIMYNHLFSKSNYKFTVKQLYNELAQYGIDVTEETIESKIENWIKSGVVKENIGYYTVCHR